MDKNALRFHCPQLISDKGNEVDDVTHCIKFRENHVLVNFLKL